MSSMLAMLSLHFFRKHAAGAGRYWFSESRISPAEMKIGIASFRRTSDFAPIKLLATIQPCSPLPRFPAKSDRRCNNSHSIPAPLSACIMILHRIFSDYLLYPEAYLLMSSLCREFHTYLHRAFIEHDIYRYAHRQRLRTESVVIR